MWLVYWQISVLQLGCKAARFSLCFRSPLNAELIHSWWGWEKRQRLKSLLLALLFEFAVWLYFLVFSLCFLNLYFRRWFSFVWSSGQVNSYVSGNLVYRWDFERTPLMLCPHVRLAITVEFLLFRLKQNKEVHARFSRCEMECLLSVDCTQFTEGKSGATGFK